jgi:hypothetical protein
MNNTEFGYCKEGMVWQKPFSTFPERIVGEMLENDEQKSLAHYSNNFSQVLDKIAVLENDFNTNANKGSYLVKIQYLKDYFLSFPAIGDYEDVYQKLNQFENEITDLIETNRIRNLEIKQALIEEAKQIIDDPDWKTVTEKLKEIRQKWIKTGAVKKELEEAINEEFRALVDGFFDKKKSFFEDKQKMFEARIEQYKEILEKAKLLEVGKVGVIAELKKLQEAWKAVGLAPKNQIENLLKEFNFIKKKFASKKPNARVATRPTFAVTPEMEQNFAKKQVMVEKAKSLAYSPVTFSTHKEIEALKAEWKNVGPVDKKVSNKQWEEFITNCDRASELAYLEHVVTKKLALVFGNEKQKTAKKAELLRNSINSDKNEIRLYEENQSMFSGKTLDKLVDNKIANRKRKLLAKEQLLQEMLDSIK